MISPEEDYYNVIEASFSKTGGYVSHGGGIQVQNLDIPPWQFDKINC